MTEACGGVYSVDLDQLTVVSFQHFIRVGTIRNQYIVDLLNDEYCRFRPKSTFEPPLAFCVRKQAIVYLLSEQYCRFRPENTFEPPVALFL